MYILQLNELTSKDTADSRLTQIMTVKSMFGKEDQQTDGAKYGRDEEYSLPFDRLTLHGQQFAFILEEYFMQFDRGQHVAE